MALVDQVTIYAKSGRGGNGVVRWRRTKTNAQGGPAGGDGGRGGDVVIVGVRDLLALSRYRNEKKFLAEQGVAGKGELKTGANGKNAILPVPVGTHIRVFETGEEYEITQEGEEITLFKGGRGGLGNAHFKSSTNQNPFDQTNGREGKGSEMELTLKIIADAGLIGLPNAGKSSLLNALTRAKSKTGDYPFTTLEPSLGEFYGYILADIPGLIEGASDGRGLGIKFLQHVERTGILLHLVSASQEDPLKAYREVRTELEAFGRGLGEKREIIVISKADLVPDADLAAHVELFVRETGKEVMTVSIHNPEMLKAFSDRLTAIFSEK